MFWAPTIVAVTFMVLPNLWTAARTGVTDATANVSVSAAPIAALRRAVRSIMPPGWCPERGSEVASQGTIAVVNPRRTVLFAATLLVSLVAGADVSRAAAIVNPWNLDRINQTVLPLDGNASMGALTGAGIDVYVVDTGVRPTHEQLNGRVVAGLDVPTVNGDAVVDPVSSDCDGHGTHVASTVAGTTTGVAVQANIISVRVLDCSGDGEVVDVVRALEWIRAHHRSGRTAIANLSLGVDLGDNGDSIIEMVKELVADGVIMVVAAGNGDSTGRGIDACRIAPGSEPLSFTVGAVTKTDTMASYSNYGPCVDIWAPGGDRASAVNAAWFRNDTDYMGDIGTSMAAPHVSGLLALLAQQQPDLCPAQYTDAVVERSTKNAILGMDATSLNRLLFVDTTPVATVSLPGTPSNVVASPDAGSLLVGWDPPCAGGSPITKYVVSVLSHGTLVTRVEVDPTRTAARVRGLVQGKKYAVVVKAVSAAGEGVSTTRLVSPKVGGLRVGRRWTWSTGITNDTGAEFSVTSLSSRRCKVSGRTIVPLSTGLCRYSIRLKDTQYDIVRTIVVSR